MKKHLKEIVKELIENLDKRGFVYQGYDNSNYCELFNLKDFPNMKIDIESGKIEVEE